MRQPVVKNPTLPSSLATTAAHLIFIYCHIYFLIYLRDTIATYGIQRSILRTWSSPFKIWVLGVELRLCHTWRQVHWPPKTPLQPELILLEQHDHSMIPYFSGILLIFRLFPTGRWFSDPMESVLGRWLYLSDWFSIFFITFSNFCMSPGQTSQTSTFLPSSHQTFPNFIFHSKKLLFKS